MFLATAGATSEDLHSVADRHAGDSDETKVNVMALVKARDMAAKT